MTPKWYTKKVRRTQKCHKNRDGEKRNKEKKREREKKKKKKLQVVVSWLRAFILWFTGETDGNVPLDFFR